MDGWITDNEPSERYPIYTRANAGEVMPDPISPMTGTAGIMTAGEAGWRRAYAEAGAMDEHEFDQDRPNTIACFGGHLYLNMSLTRIYGVRCPGMTPELVDFTYFGEMPGIPPYEEEARPTDVSAANEARMAEWLTRIMTADDLPELRQDRCDVDAVVAARPDLGAATPDELVARMRDMAPIYQRLFQRHIVISSASGVGIGTVAGVCQAVGDPGLTMRLVGAVGDVDSAAPSWAMWELSRLVAGSPEITSAFDAGVEGLLDRVRALQSSDAAAFLRDFDRFISDYGSRGPNEWELRSSVWGTRPELVLSAIERMRLAPDDESPQSHTERLRLDQEEMTAKVGEMLAGDTVVSAQFDAGLRCARLYLGGRERSKTNNILIVHEMRLALRELGRRMTEAGHLESIEQIFMLVNDELEAFIEAPASFRAVIGQRERDYEELHELEPPFVIYRNVPPIATWPRRDRSEMAKAGPGEVLSGIPGCPGTATGRARIILDPSDPTDLEPGDVLVAPVTDPAWTPLFVPAAAVIVDVGAQISHAVIVSRELGIPCVVSVTNATRIIRDGAMVTVDGTNGTVTVH